MLIGVKREARRDYDARECKMTAGLKSCEQSRVGIKLL